MSSHGKGLLQREAKKISAAVSKFLIFSGPVLDPKHLYDAKKLDSFLWSLEVQGKKPTTQHAKLCRVKQGLTYVNLSLDPAETVNAEKCVTIISNWITTLGKEARRLKRVHLEELSDKGSTFMTEIERFAKSEQMTRSLTKIVERITKGQPGR